MEKDVANSKLGDESKLLTMPQSIQKDNKSRYSNSMEDSNDVIEFRNDTQSTYESSNLPYSAPTSQQEEIINLNSNMEDSIDAMEYRNDIQRVYESGNRPYTAPRSQQDGAVKLKNNIDKTQINLSDTSLMYDDEVNIDDHSDHDIIQPKQLNNYVNEELFYDFPFEQSVNKSSDFTKIAPKRSNSVSKLDIKRTSYKQLLSKENELQEMRDYVFTNVKNAVKQTELYHKIQIHLGFISSYTMIPARGEIVQSNPRPYLSIKDIQTAFQDARLHLSNTQVQCLFLDVKKFADGLNDKDDNDEILKDGPLINSKILKKYFVYMRLMKDEKNIRQRSNSVGNIRYDKKDNKIDNKIDINKTINFNKWKNQKNILNKQKEINLLNIFNEIIQGISNHIKKLSLNQLNELSEKYLKPLSKELIDKEISNRINNWIYDLNGKRDFKSQLNKKIKKLIINTNKKLNNNMINEIKINLIKDKKNELLNLENNNKDITKELFSKYLNYCDISTMNISWNNWLINNIEKNYQMFKYNWIDDNQIENNINNDNSNNNDKNDNKLNGYIPMNELIQSFNNISKKTNIPIDNSIEINKLLLKLRKSLINNNINNLNDYKHIINIKSIDSSITNALHPFYNTLPNELKQLIELSNKKSKVLMKQFTENHMKKKLSNNEIMNNMLIYPNVNEAANKAIEIENNKINQNKDDFSRWLINKKNQQLKEIQKLEEMKLKIEKEKELKAQKGQEAFKKWLKRHKKNKYFSKIDNTVHPIPKAKIVEHKTIWRKENDLTNHYAAIDKNL